MTATERVSVMNQISALAKRLKKKDVNDPERERMATLLEFVGLSVVADSTKEVLVLVRPAFDIFQRANDEVQHEKGS